MLGTARQANQPHRTAFLPCLPPLWLNCLLAVSGGWKLLVRAFSSGLRFTPDRANGLTSRGLKLETVLRKSTVLLTENKPRTEVSSHEGRISQTDAEACANVYLTCSGLRDAYAFSHVCSLLQTTVMQQSSLFACFLFG